MLKIKWTGRVTNGKDFQRAKKVKILMDRAYN
jgi:hypothetical protein